MVSDLLSSKITIDTVYFLGLYASIRCQENNPFFIKRSFKILLALMETSVSNQSLCSYCRLFTTRYDSSSMIFFSEMADCNGFAGKPMELWNFHTEQDLV